MSESGQPRGELAIRTVAMPADANGDIFGGWPVFGAGIRRIAARAIGVGSKMRVFSRYV